MLKRKPFWLFFTGAMWVTIWPNIYYPKAVAQPEHYRDVLAHESTHLAQQSFKRWTWLGKYVFSRKFRLSQEVEAIRAQLHCYTDAQEQLSVFDWYCEQLSSWHYLWAANSPQAVREAISRGWVE